MTWASLFRSVALLALAAGCAGRVAIPPGTPPEIALPQLAREGDPDAQVSLGYMYQNGQSFEQSYSRAARWYRPAAEQGNSLAQYALGELYARGLGLDQDYSMAAYWYLRAAMSGEVSAQLQLAYLYENGFGVQRNYAAAARLYGRAIQASRGLTAPPPSIERLAGRRAYDTILLIQPPRLIPAERAAPAQAGLDVGDRIALRDAEPQPPVVDPSPAGGAWVHVASFRTKGAAANQWEMLKQRHAVLLGGLTAELVRIDLGAEKGVWVRVQAGPLADMTVAQSLCAALQAHDVYCAPVR